LLDQYVRAIFDSAIPRFESWRPSQQFQILIKVRSALFQCRVSPGYHATSLFGDGNHVRSWLLTLIPVVNDKTIALHSRPSTSRSAGAGTGHLVARRLDKKRDI
jgi:hypothetical protein